MHANGARRRDTVVCDAAHVHRPCVLDHVLERKTLYIVDGTWLREAVLRPHPAPQCELATCALGLSCERVREYLTLCTRKMEMYSELATDTCQNRVWHHTRLKFGAGEVKLARTRLNSFENTRCDAPWQCRSTGINSAAVLH